MVKAKGRPPGAPNKKKSNKAMSTTERDSSQHEVVLAAMTGDGSQLKGIHRQQKKRGRPKSAKSPPKAAAKKTTTTNKRSIETIDLTASPRRRKRLKLTYFSDSSSDGEINEEATDDITEEATDDITEEAAEEVNDDVPFELVDDVDYGGNAEVIESPVRESPVRPRRSGRERQATRRSLDYHKEMRKGR
jgi:hypothetical protein